MLLRLVDLPAKSVHVSTANRDRAEVFELYRMADVLLQPSRTEGFGMPVLEAQVRNTVRAGGDQLLLHCQFATAASPNHLHHCSRPDTVVISTAGTRSSRGPSTPLHPTPLPRPLPRPLHHPW